jgi:hypothetical protein
MKTYKVYLENTYTAVDTGWTKVKANNIDEVKSIIENNDFETEWKNVGSDDNEITITEIEELDEEI